MFSFIYPIYQVKDCPPQALRPLCENYCSAPVGVQVEVADEPTHVILRFYLATIPHPSQKHKQLSESLRFFPLEVEAVLLVRHLRVFLERRERQVRWRIAEGQNAS